MAFILVWMRKGYRLANKEQHMSQDPPTESELEAVLDEMPALLLASVPDRVA